VLVLGIIQAKGFPNAFRAELVYGNWLVHDILHRRQKPSSRLGLKVSIPVLFKSRNLPETQGKNHFRAKIEILLRN
jgi:hypothetical protein